MIKSKPTPLNTTKELEYKCTVCENFGTIYLKNSTAETDNGGNLIGDIDGFYECPNGHPLKKIDK